MEECNSDKRKSITIKIKGVGMGRVRGGEDTGLMRRRKRGSTQGVWWTAGPAYKKQSIGWGGGGVNN